MIAAADNPITTIESEATNTAVVLILFSMGPSLQNKSSSPMIKRLNRLLPNASPAARFTSPTSAIELTPVPSSGNDVAVASRTTPTKDLPSPVLRAITSADLAR